LLICGIASSLLYVAMIAFVPLLYEGYNSVSQTVSELSAIGAPTRLLWVVLGAVYTLLVAAFGLGVLMSTAGNRPLRVLGILILINGIVGLAWPLAPMQMRGAEFALTDAMHIVFSIVTVLLFMLQMAFGAAAFGRGFRLYSIATIVIVVAFGVLTGLDGPRLAANLPTPWIGLWERVSIGAFMLWIVVLAGLLLRSAEVPTRARIGSRTLVASGS
jgi:hypothetical protein